MHKWGDSYWVNKTDFRVRFVIDGPPAVLKNRQQFVRRGKHTVAVPNARAAKWHDHAAKQIKFGWPFRGPIPLEVKVAASVVTYAPDRRRRDLDNSLSGPLDAMLPPKRGPTGKVKKAGAGVLEDDSQVASLDGSRLYYDKENPRVEITLTPFLEDTDETGR